MMCGSVPQMNVVCTLHRTSSGSSADGTGTSSTANWRGARNTSARMELGSVNSLVLGEGHGPDRRSAAVPDLERQADEREGALRDQVDVAQALDVQHAPLAAHHVDRLDHPHRDLV